MIGETIYTALVDALLTPETVNAIRPVVLSETDKLPAITYTTEVIPNYDFYGESGFSLCSAEFNIFGTDLPTIEAIATTLKTALYGLKGSQGAISIHTVFLTRQIEGLRDEADEFKINLQFNIHYSEV